jgi:hypothetical protein
MQRLIMFLGVLMEKPGILVRNMPTKKKKILLDYAVEIRAAIGSTLDLMISTRRVG